MLVPHVSHKIVFSSKSVARGLLASKHLTTVVFHYSQVCWTVLCFLVANKVFLLRKGMPFESATRSVAHKFRVVGLLVLAAYFVSSHIHICRETG